MTESLAALQGEIHAMALDKGWWDEPRSVGDVIALIHSELSEALEEYRNGHDPADIRIENGKPEGVSVELADAVIRILDYAGRLGVSMEDLIRLKVTYNATRPHRHGGKAL